MAKTMPRDVHTSPAGSGNKSVFEGTQTTGFGGMRLFDGKSIQDWVND
jgi:hypothetical protein